MTDPSSLASAVSGDILRSGQSLTFWVSGNSMTPALHDGERIIVVSLGTSDVRSGDILLYDGPGGPIAHRVIGVKGADEFILRGDASLAVDTVKREQILGRVVAVERNGIEVGLAGSFSRIKGLLINHARAVRSRIFPRKSPMVH